MKRSKEKWPAELIAAIDAADRDTPPMRPKAMLEAIRNGSLDGLNGRAYKLPESTLFYHLKRLREARSLTPDPIQPGEESTEAGAVVRHAIAIAKREVKRIEVELAQPQTARERAQSLMALQRAGQTAADLKYRIDRGSAGSSGRSTSPAHRAREAARGGATTSAISRLVSQRERALSEQREPASPDPVPLSIKTTEATGAGEAARGAGEDTQHRTRTDARDAGRGVAA